MEIFETTLGQMAVLFSLILIGYLLAKLKAVPENTSTVLSKMENNLFVPALVLGTFIKHFTVEKLGTAWKLFLTSFAICLIMIVLAIVVARFCSKDSYIRNWAKEINIPYWSNGNTIIDNAVEDLKLHPYYSDKMYSIEKIKDKREFVRGISVSYELSDGSIQKTDVLFPSYSVR